MIDLHTHSTASDGTDNPGQLIQKAYKVGIKALALTDHDTLAGLEEAEECAGDLSMDFIRGCELSTRTEDDRGKGRKFHILGLWIPKKTYELDKFLSDAREIRNKRNQQIIHKLQDLGIKVELEELLAKSGDAIGRPHFAQLLVEKGYVESITEAFTKYLAIGGKAYFPKKSVSPEEAIKILSRQGAMVFIAHPLLGIDRDKDKHFLPWLAEKLPVWRALGLCGLEAWHSAQGREDTNFLIRLAREHDLAVSGGSDYHGAVKKDVRLGQVLDGRPIPDSVYLELTEYRKKNAYPDL